MKKVVIAGGSGFIGRYISNRFKESGYEVLIISRTPGYISWNPLELEKAIDNSILIINLAGKSINCRHTTENRKQLLDSRTKPTIWIGNAIQACTNPPKLWINASATGIYKPSETHAATEDETEFGTNFMAQLVQEWEKVFFGFKLPETRQIALRTSVVLGKNGGALKPLVTLSKFGLGGQIASGNQKFSWIHIEDYFRILEFLIDSPDTKKIYNSTAPHPVTNKLLMKEIRKKVRMPIGFPAPEWAVKIGAKTIGTEPELLIDSSFIAPKNLEKTGFKFLFPSIETALESLI